MYIRSLSNVDDDKGTYDAQVTFRQRWNDPRLRFEQISRDIKYITIRDTKALWLPDTFFSNEISGHRHDLLTPNELLRVDPNGDVLFSVRVTLKLSCLMDLRNMPFDTQTCNIRFASCKATVILT